MIVVKLQGGLGNQMFQYAFGRSFTEQNGGRLYFDASFFKKTEKDITPRDFELGVFDGAVRVAGDELVKSFVNPGLIRRSLTKFHIYKKTVYREKSLSVDSNAFGVQQPAYFDGFWHSEKYFLNIEQKIRQAFRFKHQGNEQTKALAAEILQAANPVSVHVRRGDYISSERNYQIHGACSITYYDNAIRLLKDRLTKPHFYFFSDEPEWVADNLLKNLADYTVVAHNKVKDGWQDMLLMSKCKHHIIANSSFSWWGAWLNPDKNKIVVAPADWFSKKQSGVLHTGDLIPERWIQIPSE